MAESTRHDPLAGLEDIDWAKLQHAYGSAEDVPALLKALRCHDKEELDQVYFALTSNILHQGTRYEATSYAVPFLYALLDAKDTPRRDELLYYLVNVAVGHPSTFVPSGVDVAKWRDRVAETQQPNYLEEQRRKKDEYIASATDDQDRRRRESEYMFTSPKRDTERQIHGLGAYDAVGAGLDSVYDCLKDENADLRAVASFCLGFFPEHKIKTKSELLALVEHENDVAVHGTALLSLALLQAPSAGDLSQTEAAQYLKDRFNKQDTDEASRWSSAIGLAILRIYETESIEMILRAIADDDYLSVLQHDHCKRFPFAQSDLASLAASVLKVKASEFPQVVQAALPRLESLKGHTQIFFTELVLDSCFDGKPLGRQFSELTGIQQEAVRALVKVDQWRLINFLWILEKWGIPSSKEKLEAYIDGKNLDA